MSDDEPVFSPPDFLRWLAQRRNVAVASLKVPERLLITYQHRDYVQAKECVNGDPVDWWPSKVNPLCVGKFKDVDIGIGCFGVGAPATVMMLEEAIACGVKVVFEVGIAGGLQAVLQPGDLVVVTEAIRDEGTSFHYLPPEARVESSPHLREGLIQCLKEKKLQHFVGPVWSIDAVYRETRGKLRKFRDASVLAVDMETSAIFAVCQFRKVEVASALVISDILTETGWLQAFDHQAVTGNMTALLREVVEVLSKH